MAMRAATCTSIAAAFMMAAASSLAAQTPAAAPAQSPASQAAEVADGIPVQSELVRARCGGCHKSDDHQRMSRISYRRATPENWERTIKRMVALNHARLEPADARAILKYLSDHQGLAPEEARPIAFEVERRTIEYSYTGDKDTAETCGACHSVSRVLMERRTKQEWELLVAMHRGLYPLVDNQPITGGQGFRRSRPAQTEPGPDGQAPDNRHPMDKAIEHWSKTLPLKTAEWSAWSAAMQPPQLTGRWIIVGTALGKGPIYGEMTVTADSSAPDSFNTEVKYTIPRTGESVSRSSKALGYTGYQWRGRGAVPGAEMPWREVMFIERGWGEMWGRWFTGAYDETGIDVRLIRATTAPVVSGTSVASIKSGTSAQGVKIFGANLPSTLKPEDISLGQGVRVTRVVSANANEATVDIDVAANAPVGLRDLSVAGAGKPSALAVYDRIDGVRVLPQAGLARVGGAVFPKQLQQFEAVAFNNGPDGKPGTADDLMLGVVDAKWSVEEYTATFDDDDVKFVGEIDQKGLFTPALDGPNPKRTGNRNNVGDVWVVAEIANPAGGQPLRGRAQLLVTVPLYMQWFEGEPQK